MPTAARVAGSLILLVLALVCAFLSVAAREAPPEAWWAFWLLYGVVGGASALGAVALLWPRRRRAVR